MYSLPSCLLRVLRSSIAVAASRPASRAHISLSNPSNLQHHPFSSSATTTASTNKPGSPGFRSNVLRTADMKPKYGKQGVADSDKLATDLDSLNLLGDIPPPTTAVDTCLNAGFHLNNGLKITDAGCLLVNGEVFTWRPWECQDGGVMLNRKGQFDVSEEAWGLLRVLWPKPDLLVLGLGESMHPLSPETRRQISLLGMRLELQSTRNAAAQFNLLATERGVSDVAAALLPAGWTGR